MESKKEKMTAEMKLRELKSRYNCKCSVCGRNIRENWNIYYDDISHKPVCQPCGISITKGEKPEVNSEVPPQTETEEKQSRFNEMMSALTEIRGVNDAQSALIQMQIDATAKLTEVVNKLEVEVRMIIDKDKSKKKTETEKMAV